MTISLLTFLAAVLGSASFSSFLTYMLNRRQTNYLFAQKQWDLLLKKYEELNKRLDNKEKQADDCEHKYEELKRKHDNLQREFNLYEMGIKKFPNQ